jgi:predicted O-linked N-acetylglucosamine transferase (SPINDLY family)
MAGALLTAAGMAELISYTLAEYEEKAVTLGLNPAECKRLREQLKEVRATGALFDTGRFARNLEQRLQKLVAEL